MEKFNRNNITLSESYLTEGNSPFINDFLLILNFPSLEIRGMEFTPVIIFRVKWIDYEEETLEPFRHLSRNIDLINYVNEQFKKIDVNMSADN